MKKKSLLFSVRPFYACKIATGEKKIEIRKFKPDIELPFRVYLYCTSSRYMTLFDYVEANAQTGGAIDGWKGKVFAEFTCTDVVKIDTSIPDDNMKLREHPFDKACLTPNQIISYIGFGKTGYGLVISDLHVFEKPLDVTDFSYAGCADKLKHPPQNYCFVNDIVLSSDLAANTSMKIDQNP